MRYFLVIFALVVFGTVSILGFRGKKSEKEPLYIFPDMDIQAKYLPQGKNDFFNDQRNDRPVIAGTIPRGHSWDMANVFSPSYDYKVDEQPEFYTGKTSTGAFVTGFPVEVDHSLMEKGREKYQIFCQVCHSAAGDGNGITKQYGMVATASYQDDRLRNMPEGEIFNTITNGKGQMLPYRDKLSPEERWAVIAYVRALQRSQNARMDDVPEAMRMQLTP